MNNLPPFAVAEGYPFVPAVSLEEYPPDKRIGEIMHIQDGVINMTKPLLEKKFGLEPNAGDNAFDKAFYLGITDRLLMAEFALKEAEAQIEDMMKDIPFRPEDFGFIAVIAPGSIEDDPIHIYKSELDNGILLTRVIGTPNDWLLLKDGLKMPFTIVCSRVALCLFTALNIRIKLEPTIENSLTH